MSRIRYTTEQIIRKLRIRGRDLQRFDSDPGSTKDRCDRADLLQKVAGVRWTQPGSGEASKGAEVREHPSEETGCRPGTGYSNP